ncbi:MAG: aminoacyltransferase [bacterium]|nr:aminoacyltransferase [bacterium]
MKIKSRKSKPGVELTLEIVDQETWDNLIDVFEDTSPEQTGVFMNERWGKNRTICIILKHGDEIVAGACVVLFVLPLLGRGIAYIKHGPLWRRREVPLDICDYSAAIEALVNEFGRKQGHAVLFMPRPCPKTLDMEEKALREAGFTGGRENIDPNRYVVNATLDEDEQLRSLGQKWRYHLRRVLKNDLTISVGNQEEDIEAFKSLYSSMISRKRFDSTDPIDALPKMLVDLPESLRPTIFLCRHKDQLVAGAVVCICGDTAYYVFGASNHQALSLKAGYGVQWSILEFLRMRDIKWYDLGGEAGTTGLGQFKKGLVGKEGIIMQVPGELYYCPDFTARCVSQIIFTAHKVLRKLRSFEFPGRRRR